MDCPLCGARSSRAELAEARWSAPHVLARILGAHPGWQRTSGACPACVQHALLGLLLEKGGEALHDGVQKAWPLDAEAAFGALPTPLRLHADPRFTGRGVTLALVDAAFHPHPDLVRPVNRIRAWVDASRDDVQAERFRRNARPKWPGWDRAASARWCRWRP